MLVSDSCPCFKKECKGYCAVDHLHDYYTDEEADKACSDYYESCKEQE